MKQYRPALEKTSLELPSGHVELDQTPEEAARSELLEETGYKVDELELLGKINPDPGRLSNKLWVFFTDKIKKVEDYTIEDGLDVRAFKLVDIKSLIEQNKINHSMNLAAFFLAREKLFPYG